MELSTLLSTQTLAALGTVHASEPFVSMVPYAIDSAGKFIIHVSTLAAHTKYMLANPKVSLLVMALPTPDVSAQETPRITIQGAALQLNKTSSDYSNAKVTYLDRFLQSEYLFDFADFSLFVITPTLVRSVAGFARATTLSAEEFATALNA